MAEITDYAAIYRRMHPKQFPYSPYEKQMELADLWPSEQEKFKRGIDAVMAIPITESELARTRRAAKE